MQNSNGTRVSGTLGGALLAPLTGFTSWLRQSRMFHPRGILCRAEVRPRASTLPERRVAERLAGPALLRWSSAWWKRGEWPDVLGCAVRFTREPLDVRAKVDDQDLLFATIRRPWTMAFAPLSTQVHDFLSNSYFAVSPFEVKELGRIEWRLRAEEPSPPGDDRQARLEQAIVSHRKLLLEYCAYRSPRESRDDRAFRPLAVLELESVIELDQEALRFDPFQHGRDIVPVGFVHALRRATYATSQYSRPQSAT